MDPCTCAANPVGALSFLTPADNGLKTDWVLKRGEGGVPEGDPVTVFVNPPFEHTGAWVQKVLHEFANGSFDVGLLLVQESLGNKWALPLLHKFHWGVFYPKLCFSKLDKAAKKLKPAKKSAKFNNMLVLLSNEPKHVDLFAKCFSRLLQVQEPLRAVKLVSTVSP